MDNAVTPGAVPSVHNPIKNRRSRTQHPDRVWIKANALNRLNHWVNEATERLRGVKLSRTDLVNFLILSHPEALSTQEMKEIEMRYFDPVKQGEWALGELRAARARGEQVTLEDILVGQKAALPAASRSRTRKSENLKITEKPDKNAQKQLSSTDPESLISVETTGEK